MKHKKTKAIVLFSGGLDSRLAIKLLQEQGIEVTALYVQLSFGSGCCKFSCAFNFSQMQGVMLKMVDATKGALFRKFISIVKNPKNGHGSAMNPCIDCRIFLLEQAKKLAKKMNADFIATGEVLEERPMSQRMNAMRLIEKESGLEGKLLRPLSAKLLAETEAEKKGLVDRSKLLAIKGRQRKVQLELAKKYNIKFPSPAGGCLLCEREFANRLKDIFQHNKKITETDIELLKIGRHFRIGKTKIIVGRNKEENDKLEKYKENNIVMEAENIPSPITLATEKADKETMQKAAEITARYADCENECMIKYNKEKKEIKIKAKKATQEELDKLRI